MTNTGDSPRIRYNEGCLAAHALNFVGDRWALLVVRELMLRPKRFQAIRAGLPGITAAVLTTRLGQLADAGVLRHDPLDATYALTPAGQALHPVLVALCHWGAGQPGHDPRRFISPTALMISMTAMIDGVAARGRVHRAGFEIGAESFVQELDGDGVLRLGAVASVGAGVDFVLGGDANWLAAAVYGTAPLTALAESGMIGLRGDGAAAQDYVGLFSLQRADAGHAVIRPPRALAPAMAG